MADIFTPQKCSEVMSRICGREKIFLKTENTNPKDLRRTRHFHS
jgi:hypothetical protein